MLYHQFRQLKFHLFKAVPISIAPSLQFYRKYDYGDSVQMMYLTVVVCRIGIYYIDAFEYLYMRVYFVILFFFLISC